MVHLYNVAANVNFVSVYSAETHHRQRIITKGLLGPRALAFDPAGNLYLANTGNGSNLGFVGVYKAGQMSRA